MVVTVEAADRTALGVRDALAGTRSDRTGVQARIASVDFLRGLVMVIMALDHVRDVFSNATFDPTDLAHTTPALFLTRWITHFCAPVFVLLAGTGAYLATRNGRTTKQLSGFLATRGLWLIFLEIAVVSPLGWSFNFGFGFTRLQVIWVIGAAMVILAGLVRVAPRRVIGGIGVAIILGHNLFDGPHAAWFGGLAPAWRMLHDLTPISIGDHRTILSIYPIVPWFGIMAAGYGFGDFIAGAAYRSRRLLIGGGLALIAAFVMLRFSNLYGDPHPWAVQSMSLMTVLSFLNVNKYPPSLLYTLMTLGPALVLLGVVARAPAKLTAPLATLGRVPLFYYLLHLPLIHLLAVLFSLARFGGALWLMQDMMVAKHSAHPLPADYGYGLEVVYAVWTGVVVALYPLCRWYAGVKARGTHPLLSYL